MEKLLFFFYNFFSFFSENYIFLYQKIIKIKNRKLFIYFFIMEFFFKVLFNSILNKKNLNFTLVKNNVKNQKLK